MIVCTRVCTCTCTCACTRSLGSDGNAMKPRPASPAPTPTNAQLTSPLTQPGNPTAAMVALQQQLCAANANLSVASLAQNLPMTYFMQGPKPPGSTVLMSGSGPSNPTTPTTTQHSVSAASSIGQSCVPLFTDPQHPQAAVFPAGSLHPPPPPPPPTSSSSYSAAAAVGHQQAAMIAAAAAAAAAQAAAAANAQRTLPLTVSSAPPAPSSSSSSATYHVTPKLKSPAGVLTSSITSSGGGVV